MGRALRKTLLLGAVLPAVAYLTVHAALSARGHDSAVSGVERAAVDLDTISPQIAFQMGLVPTQPTTELVAVVISATWCAANEVQGYHGAIHAIPRLLSDQISDRPEMVARVIGVSVDSDPHIGMDYLFDLAEFDEVVAGGVGWLNTAAEKFLWGRPYISAGSIPQIVLLRRTVTWSGNIVTIEDERELGKRVGAEEIIEWVASGAPIHDSLVVRADK